MANKALRQLLDFELEAAGWSTGQIREVRRYLLKGTKNAHQRRLVLKYQQLRRDIVAKEDLAAEKAAKRAKKVAKAADPSQYVVFTPDRLSEIPDQGIREKAIALAAVWPTTEAGVFPGVATGRDVFNAGKANYYVNWFSLPAGLGAMCRNSSKAPYTKRTEVPAGQYPYGTVSVRTALSRAKRGLPLFA